MPWNLRWKAAKSGGDQIGETNHRQQSAGDFRFGVARTRDEVLDKQRDKKHKSQ